jgi:hypothetical protein
MMLDSESFVSYGFMGQGGMTGKSIIISILGYQKVVYKKKR